MNEYFLLIPIILPFISGLLAFFIHRKIQLARELIAIITLLLCLIFTVRLCTQPEHYTLKRLYLVTTPLSEFMLLGLLSLSLLVFLFSIKIMRDNTKSKLYYTYSLWAITLSAICLFTDNLIMLLVVWGALAVLLYLLILMGKPGAEKAGYKSLIMIGGSDVLMLIGTGIIYYLTNTLTINNIKIPFTEPLSYIAFILLLIGVFTKLGIVPFHTWLPDTAEKAPAPVLALFLAVIDKILGVYLLIKITQNMFILIPNCAMSILLMVIGSLTIITGAGMALMQNDLMKLLAYSTISQVGYIIMGIGTSIPIGIIGGLFHMVNNIIFKTSLFMSGGAIEFRTKKTDLAKQGGLAQFMPITFIATFISALAISGIPPLNGFVSKWFIYQSLIGLLNSYYDKKWFLAIFIILAMLGSVFTLAYFLKAIYSVFWQTRSKELPQVKEVSWTMYLPNLVLAIISLLLGIFAFHPLQYILAPMLDIKIVPLGFWNPGTATLLIILGIIIGIVVYIFTRSKKIIASEVFIGGERISPADGDVKIEQVTFPGVAFYDSIKKIKLLSDTYRIADNKFFDIFEQSSKILAIIIRQAKKIHNGLLQTYLGWLFLGVIAIVIIFFILLLR